jgi:hypothetical protein
MDGDEGTFGAVGPLNLQLAYGRCS